MLVKEELAKLRGGDREALEALFKNYSHEIYREALIKNNGNQKAAAKAVLDTFYNINAIAKDGNAQEIETAAAVLKRVEQEKKIEGLCLDAVWRSLNDRVSANEPSDTVIVNNEAWINGKKMETVAHHAATMNEAYQYQQTEQLNHEIPQPMLTQDEEGKNNVLLEDYPDDVIEGLEMETKRKKMSKQNIVMLVIIIVLVLFLVWSLLGIVLAMNQATDDVDYLGFNWFITTIKNLIT